MSRESVGRGFEPGARLHIVRRWFACRGRREAPRTMTTTTERKLTADAYAIGGQCDKCAGCAAKALGRQRYSPQTDRRSDRCAHRCRFLSAVEATPIRRLSGRCSYRPPGHRDLAEADGSATWVVGIANSSCWNRVKTRRMPMTRSTCRASVRIRGTCWRTPWRSTCSVTYATIYSRRTGHFRTRSPSRRTTRWRPPSSSCSPGYRRCRAGADRDGRCTTGGRTDWSRRDDGHHPPRRPARRAAVDSARCERIHRHPQHRAGLHHLGHHPEGLAELLRRHRR